MTNALNFINMKVDACLNDLRTDLFKAAKEEDFSEINSIRLQLDMVYMFSEWLEKAIEMEGDDGK